MLLAGAAGSRGGGDGQEPGLSLLQRCQRLGPVLSELHDRYLQRRLKCIKMMRLFPCTQESVSEYLTPACSSCVKPSGVNDSFSLPCTLIKRQKSYFYRQEPIGVQYLAQAGIKPPTIQSSLTTEPQPPHYILPRVWLHSVKSYWALRLWSATPCVLLYLPSPECHHPVPHSASNASLCQACIQAVLGGSDVGKVLMCPLMKRTQVLL